MVGREGKERIESDTHFWRHQSAQLSLAAAANCFSGHSRNIDAVINQVILGPISQRRLRRQHVVRAAETYCWTSGPAANRRNEALDTARASASAVSVTVMQYQASVLWTWSVLTFPLSVISWRHNAAKGSHCSEAVAMSRCNVMIVFIANESYYMTHITHCIPSVRLSVCTLMAYNSRLGSQRKF